MMAGLRVWLLGLLAVAAWFLAEYAVPLPPPLPADAPVSAFSAGRAMDSLSRLLGREKPHPAGTAENSAMHARLMGELARQGIEGQTISGMRCFGRAGGASCGMVSDILAEAIPGDGKALLLMAHMDSVAAGPGAADDASGVAIVLETIRALKDEGDHSHPVIVLFTDGEELDLLGAGLFLDDLAWRGRVGAVINVEARGNHGQSYLFQTSSGDAKLIDLYAANVTHPAASSLYDTIYRYLPNDTDLTPFLQAGFPGYNFAFIGDLGQYHTVLDTKQNLSAASLQSQGEAVLGTARGLESADWTNLRSSDEIYFDVLGRFLPRLAASLALPLLLCAFVAIALAGWLNGRGRKPRRGKLAAAIMPLLFLLGALAAGFALEAIAGLIAGDMPFAHPVALRISLAAGVWMMALLTMGQAGATASWLWLCGLGIVAAVFAPGLSPYFLFPSLIAAALLLLTIGFGRSAALLIASIAMLVVWIGFAAQGEAIMGIAAHPLFTLPTAIGMIALLPLMGLQKMSEGFWRFSVMLSLVVALGFAVTAGFEPAFSATQPERLNLRYVEMDGKSWWLADPVRNLPDTVRAAAAFSKDPLVLAAWRGYVAPAGIVQLPSPTANVSRNGASVTLDLRGSKDADGMQLLVPSGLSSVTVNGAQAKGISSGDGRSLISCAGGICASARVVLNFSGPVARSILVAETRYGLPSDAAFMVKARPDWAKPSGNGDLSFAAADVPIPDAGS